MFSWWVWWQLLLLVGWHAQYPGEGKGVLWHTQHLIQLWRPHWRIFEDWGSKLDLLSQRTALDSGALLEGQTESFRLINSPGLLSPTRHREAQGCEIWGVPATENFLSLQDYVWTRPLLAPSKDSETMGTCFFQRWEDLENVCRFRWKPLSYVLTSRSRRPTWSLPASNGCNW